MTPSLQKRTTCVPRIAQTFLGVALIGLTTLAIAAPPSQVSITTQGLVEEQSVAPDGKKELKRVPATRLVPGMTVIFVNTVVNQGTAPAENVVVKNPIPDHVTYVDGSAKGDGTTITYSVDGGKTFDFAAKLQVTTPEGKKRPAYGIDYTHVRWQFNQPLAAKAVAEVEFKTRVK